MAAASAVLGYDWSGTGEAPFVKRSYTSGSSTSAGAPPHGWPGSTSATSGEQQGQDIACSADPTDRHTPSNRCLMMACAIYIAGSSWWCGALPRQGRRWAAWEPGLARRLAPFF